MTTITYDLPKNTSVNLSVYDIKGSRIATLINASEEGGHKKTIWNGTDDFGRSVSAGVYLCRMEAGKFKKTRKMLLLK